MVSCFAQQRRSAVEHRQRSPGLKFVVRPVAGIGVYPETVDSLKDISPVDGESR